MISKELMNMFYLPPFTEEYRKHRLFLFVFAVAFALVFLTVLILRLDFCSDVLHQLG